MRFRGTCRHFVTFKAILAYLDHQNAMQPLVKSLKVPLGYSFGTECFERKYEMRVGETGTV